MTAAGSPVPVPASLARRFYDESKLARSRERFPPDLRGARFRNAFFDAIGDWPSH